METYKKSVLEYDDVQDAILFMGEKRHREGRQEGRREGRQKGREEKQWEMITRGLQEGVPIELIAKMSNLSTEYILMKIR